MSIRQDQYVTAAASKESAIHTKSSGAAFAASLLTAAGLFGFWRELTGPGGLWQVLTGDSLRSIGLLIPPISLWLACQKWSWADWSRGGSWLGLLLMAVALALSALKSVVFHNGVFQLGGAVISISLIPIGVLLFLYFSGATILFGGMDTWRKARFPLVLWLFINPVPHFFDSLMDLPLQTLAAQATRGFAHRLGVPVDGAALKMMFSPELGIFIAPGCDGLRGAVAMGYMALVVGYLHRLAIRPWALFVVGAILLAYLLNFARLCGVIVYYWFALRIPLIGRFGADIDYAIGGIMFFLAALFLLRVPRLRAI